MLSVTIVARDASVILSGCLESARKVSDDVIVVTNSSHKFVNYSDQKNYAASKCKYDWILSLDADEWLENGLIKEIGDIKDWSYGGFLIKRKNIILGKVMRHTNWEPEADKHIWLYNRNVGKWIGNVHEEVVVSGQIGELQNYKMHENYSSVEQFISKMNDYTNREEKAQNPCYDFLRRYIWHSGFLDGWHGLFLSYLQVISHLVVWVKLWEKKNSRLPSS